MFKILFVLFTLNIHVVFNTSNIPVVITTWRFVNATVNAWEVLEGNGSALDAVQRGTTRCEEEQCDGTVGYGGSPDENGETTLDAMIMDGKTMNVGAVAALRRIKNAAAVARHVLDHTKHSMLAGDLATQFAVQMGFEEESLTTPVSKKIWMEWHNDKHCQPNFWTAVTPDPSKQCGPYKPSYSFESENYMGPEIDRYNHDTIGMVAIDHTGNIAAGTSTNGAKHKIPGRVGDSPVAGAGAYADDSVGGAASTGDGDLMLRFMPSFLAVEEMRRGSSPTKAAQVAISRIAQHYPDFMGAVVAITKHGAYGAACNGMYSFPYTVHDKTSEHPRLEQVECN